MTLLEVVLIARLSARQLSRLLMLGWFPTPRSYCSILVWDEDEIEAWEEVREDPEIAALIIRLAGEP